MPKGVKRPLTGRAIWPGVDLLAAGSNVILPGARANNGKYTILRGFNECEVPEAPVAFIKLLRDAPRPKKPDLETVPDLPAQGAGTVSARQWFLLRRSKVFWTMWDRRKLYGESNRFLLRVPPRKTLLLNWTERRTDRHGPAGLVDETRPQSTGGEVPESNHSRCLGGGAGVCSPLERNKWAGSHKCCIITSLWTGAARRGRPLSLVSRRVLELNREHPDWTKGQLAAAAGVRQRHVSMILARHGESDTGIV